MFLFIIDYYEKFYCFRIAIFFILFPLFQIFDKLFQSFGGDVLQTLFNSAEGLANSPPENMGFWIGRFISDQVLAVAASNILLLEFWNFSHGYRYYDSPLAP